MNCVSSVVFCSFISARGSATNVLPTLLVIMTQLKAEAFYLEKCKTTSVEAFHFLLVEVPDFPLEK